MWTVRPIRHSHGELKASSLIHHRNIFPAPRVRPIRHSHGELKEEILKKVGINEPGIVRPIRHSHGELKERSNSCITLVFAEVVRPIRHSHGELKDNIAKHRPLGGESQ